MEILQYVDDTILFLEDNLDKASNMKTILQCFEQVSGMRINYSKSELITLEMDSDRASTFADIFSCVIGKLPIK